MGTQKEVSPLGWSLDEKGAIREAVESRIDAKDGNFTALKITTQFHSDVYKTLLIALGCRFAYKGGLKREVLRCKR